MGWNRGGAGATYLLESEDFESVLQHEIDRRSQLLLSPALFLISPFTSRILLILLASCPHRAEGERRVRRRRNEAIGMYIPLL